MSERSIGSSASSRSALWAAFGDAIGFISELTNKSGLMHRAGVSHLDRTLPWRRRIGGQFGVEADLPEGSYSDDTQLRLATCRAIRGDGRFDVEAFSKVELTVWPAYALGAGRGSKAAASSLTRHVSTWSTNFFESGNIRYIGVGGNGAAMRIQPHVWASRSRSDLGTYLPDVVRNSITTHGHPRGFVGAAFHSIILAKSIEGLSVPDVRWVKEHLDSLQAVTAIISRDVDLQDYWLRKWETESQRTLASAVDDTIQEMRELVNLASSVEFAGPGEMYHQICDVLDIRGDALRGSGTHTAIASYFLALLFQDDPIGAIVAAANELGTDTDSIASMAGAILGPIANADPPGQVQDAEYIEREANRLDFVSRLYVAETFQYPDLLRWQPPQTQIDVVGVIEGRTAVSGLGYVARSGDVIRARGKSKGVWQWLQLNFGQTVLAKVREPMLPLATSATPPDPPVSSKPTTQQLVLTEEHALFQERDENTITETRHRPKKPAQTVARGERFWDVSAPRHREDDGFEQGQRSSTKLSLPDIESLADRIEESGFRSDLIGRYIARFASLEHGAELGAIFTSAVIRRMSKKGKKV